jgi:hypothetical protein
METVVSAPRWFDAASRYAAISSVDPYIDLTFGTTEARFFPPRHQAEWISVLLRLSENTSIGDFARGCDFAQGHDWSNQVRVPTLYRQPVAGLEGQKYCTAYVKRAEFLDLLEKSPTLQSAILRISLGQFSDSGPRRGEPLQADGAQAEPTGTPELGTVVMGVIDDGLAFAHERFRLAEFASRIEYLWLQDGDQDPAGPPLPYGREFRKQDIDRLLARYEPSRVDEDDLYRRAGVLDLASRRHQSIARHAAHGTHVMDLACGYDFRREARYDRPIVGVQLPAASTADTSGATLDDFGLDAIRYILDRADAIARRRGSARLPVVINFSYGNVAGPHDGSSDLEQAIDALVCARGTTPMGHNQLQVVLPAGNSNLGRLHAEVSLADEQPVDLHWKVLPDDRTPSFMELWLPDTSPDQVRLRIRPPGGAPSDPLPQESGAGMQLRSDGGVLCEARYREVPRPTERGMFLIALQPTTRPIGEDSAQPVAPSGVWTVTLERVSAAGHPVVEAWIQRDDTPFGYRRRGRQSFFDEPCYRRFDRQGRPIETDHHPDQPPCHIQRAGSINAIATGAQTTVVGGRLGKEERLASYSARPEDAAKSAVLLDSEISDDSLVHGGVLAAGTRSGSIVALRGTSVAAPQRARYLADLIGPPKGKEPRPEFPRPRRFRGQRAAE